MEERLLKDEFRRHLEEFCPESELKTWFDPLTFVRPDGEHTLQVSFPHPFFAEWFKENNQTVFERHLYRFLGPGYTLVYNNGESGNKGFFATTSEKKLLDFPFGSEFTFDTFVTNNKNYFPYITAQEISKKNDVSFNPFIITGPSGSGKTHLLKSIANEISKRKNPDKLFLGTAEDIYNLFNHDYQYNQSAEKNKLLEYQYFFLDDLQGLRKHRQLQSELAGLVDYFYENQRQMVFCCSEKLSAHKFLDPMLKSRLEWGLQVNLKEPDLDIRLRYISRLCREKNIILSKDQSLDLARRFPDLRALHGILIKFQAFSRFMRKDLTREDYKRILKQTVAGPEKSVKHEDVLETVAAYFELSVQEITGLSRKGNIAKARQIAVYLCREMVGSSYPELGRVFGGRDHSTVLYSVKKVAELRKENKEMKKLVDNLKRKCLERVEE